MASMAHGMRSMILARLADLEEEAVARATRLRTATVRVRRRLLLYPSKVPVVTGDNNTTITAADHRRRRRRATLTRATARRTMAAGTEVEGTQARTRMADHRAATAVLVGLLRLLLPCRHMAAVGTAPTRKVRATTRRRHRPMAGSQACQACHLHRRLSSERERPNSSISNLSMAAMCRLAHAVEEEGRHINLGDTERLSIISQTSISSIRSRRCTLFPLCKRTVGVAVSLSTCDRVRATRLSARAATATATTQGTTEAQHMRLSAHAPAFLLALTGSLLSCAAAGAPIIERAGSALDPETWAKDVDRPGATWLVEHFSPYCSHCRSFAPTWKECK